MESADQVLQQFLESVPLEQGYAEDSKLGYRSETSASRLFGGPERRSATFRVTRSESAEKALEFAQFEFDKRFKWKQQRQLPVEPLEFGDLSFIFQDRYTEWEGSAVKGPWSCSVSRGYKQPQHGRSAREAVQRDLQALFSVLPADSGQVKPAPQTNNVAARPDARCTEEIRRLLTTPLSQLSADELAHLTQVTGVANTGKFMSDTHSPTPVGFLDYYRETIIEAARATQLSPEIVASVILSEVRGLDSRVFTSPTVSMLEPRIQSKIVEKSIEHLDWAQLIGPERFLAALLAAHLSVPILLEKARSLEDMGRVFGIEFNEAWRDQILSLYSDKISIGLGQRQVNSLINMEVHLRFPELANLSDQPLRKRLREMLLDPHDCIHLTAWFVRGMAEQAARYQGPRQQQLMAWAASNACGEFDLAQFGRPVTQWTAAHLRFIGWKYNTGHLQNLDDIAGVHGWGDMFLNSYKDIVVAQLFQR